MARLSDRSTRFGSWSRPMTLERPWPRGASAGVHLTMGTTEDSPTPPLAGQQLGSDGSQDLRKLSSAPRCKSILSAG